MVQDAACHILRKPWLGRRYHADDLPVVLHIHVMKLQEYGLFINAQGGLTVENFIQFSEFRGAWIYGNVALEQQGIFGQGFSLES